MKKLLLAICLLFIFQQSEAQEKQKFDQQFYRYYCYTGGIHAGYYAIVSQHLGKYIYEL